MSDPRENPIVLLERLNAVGIQIELRSGRLQHERHAGSHHAHPP